MHTAHSGTLVYLTVARSRFPRAVGRVPVGIAAGAVLAFTSAMVDATGQKFVAEGYVDDGATPGKNIYPYQA